MAKSKSKSNGPSTSALHQPVQASTSSALTSFSPSYYAHVSLALDAHTVRIFEVASGRCVNRWAAADEQNEKVGALQWVDLQVPATEATESKRTKKRSRKSSLTNGIEGSSVADESSKKTDAASDSVSVLALGLSDGSIIFLHPTNAGILKRLTHASSSQPITSLSFGAGSANLLWSASADGQILAWALPNSEASSGHLAGKLPAFGKEWSSVAVSYSNFQDKAKAHILVGKHNVKIIEAELPLPSSQLQDLPHRLIGSCTGHPSRIASLQWITLPKSSQLAFLSTAIADRTIHFWVLKPSSHLKEAEASLVATFGLDSHVHKALCASATANNFDVAAISEQGTVSIASFALSIFSASEKPNGATKSPAKAKITSLRPLSEIAAKGVASSDTFIDFQSLPEQKGELRLARAGIKPQFDIVSYSSQGSYIKNVEVSRLAKGKGVLVNGQDEDEDMGAPAQRTRPSATSGATQASTAPLADFEDDPALTSTNPGELDVNMAEPTLADRLKSLAVQKDAAASTSADSSTILPIPSASLTQSLVQALHSNDSKLLESCLIHSKEKIIRSTVKRLPAHLVIPLVEALVERLGRSKRGYGVGVSGVHASRGKALVQWMRAVLVLHIAHLITVPGLVARLSTLHRTIEARLALHEPLLALSGRLELVCSQIELRREAIAAREAKTASMRSGRGTIHIVEGEESDSADEEMADDAGSHDEDDDDDDDEGSIEDVGLGPRADSEDGSEDEGVEGFMDLEADLSGEEAEGLEGDFHTDEESEGDVSDLIDDGSESDQSSDEEI